MARQYSVSLRSAKQAAIEATVGTSPKFRIYTGSKPATCADAATGTMLVEMTLPTDWASVTDGVTSKVGTWSGTAGDTGTAGYYRIWDSAGTTCHEQGTCGAGSGDLSLDSTSITSGQTVTITGYTITEGGA